MPRVASAKRQVTDHIAGTPSIWPVMTYQVEPQISEIARNGSAMRGRSSALGGGAAQEHLVGFDRVQQPLGSGSGDLGRGGVGSGGVVQPQVVLEHGEDLGGEITAFRLQDRKSTRLNS